MRLSPLVLSLAASCVLTHADGPIPETDPDPAAPERISAGLPDLEPAPAASPRLADTEPPGDAADRIDSWFEGHGTHRAHIQLDRPLYRPGDTVWIKTWSASTRPMSGQQGSLPVTYELLDPRGTVVQTKQVRQEAGAATNDFTIDRAAPGGKWTLKATLATGEVDERPFVVASYQAPRIRKQLEFAREAYGPGETVQALVEMETPSGEPLADHPVRALLQIAGDTVLDTELRTDRSGAVMVSAELPHDLASSDGLLTVLVEDGGVVESISRSVPIVLADLQLAFFPEGGELIRGLPGRVYFEATDPHGGPADVEGHVEDDRGERVASFASVHDGLGLFAFTPEKGRKYRAVLTRPVGVIDTFTLPAAEAVGCALRSYDDVRSERDAVTVGVRCTEPQDIFVTGVLHEQVIDSAVVAAGPDREAVVELRPEASLADRQGAVRVTVFDKDLGPVAERLVYRNPGRDLRIEITPDRDQYGPRDLVALTVQTTDPSGDPVAAELALAVVDDTVISLADDEEGHMLTRLYLEPELVDSPDDPAWYFDPDEALAARGLDLVMGTKGYRTFEWHRVWEPEPEIVATLDTGMWRNRQFMDEIPMMAPEMDMVQPVAAAPAKPVARPPRMPRRQEEPPPVMEHEPMPDGMDVAGDHDEAFWFGPMEAHREQMDFGAAERFDHNRAAWAPVRVFPKPDYREGFTGVRTDFRDTVHWEPTVRTGDDGKAQVDFYLSDAITTFRVTAEGLGAGLAGHGEQTLTSVLPVSIATVLPSAVSAGDTLYVPLTVSNSRRDDLRVDVSGSFDSEMLTAGATSGRLTLDGKASDTWWIPVEVGQGSGTATVRLSAEGGGLSDTLERPLEIVPGGFPRAWSASGDAAGKTVLSMQLDEVVPGSLTASVTWHPSTVSTLIGGMEGLIRTPGGCFEQTSSTNWPNVAILSYLEAHDGDPRLRMQSSQALDAGYAKLTGYQVGAGGFETWGSGPGKEALSAFGLLQFSDMQRVYPVDDAVLTRDAEYLLAQRDGKGGFKNSGESAHGYGSAPAPVLNGFITYALVATGHAGALDAEIAHQASVARTSTDPYVLALAARSLQGAGHPDAGKAAERLAAMQAEDGSFPGAESSITRSYEANLLVESTSLSALALMESGRYRPASDKAADWLVNNRQGAGTWGATQATALALSALSTHAEMSRRPQHGGTVSVEVNGQRVGTLDYAADGEAALVIEGWEQALVAGDNEIVLRSEGGDALPFTVDVSWKAIEPTTDPGAELSLSTTLAADVVGMGETVRLTARVGNQAGRIVPSPIARIGLPAGLEAQTWQLKELQERGEIAFFETRPREVTLYWDGIHADETHEVALDLVARVPGTFTGPASSAYPYYNDDEKAWGAGVEVKVARP